MERNLALDKINNRKNNRDMTIDEPVIDMISIIITVQKKGHICMVFKTAKNFISQIGVKLKNILDG